jgi:outer membrane protein assembly factor BamB
MRAYAMRDGAVVWDVDTAKSFAAVNGVIATGGAVSGYPVIVADGTVYVTSGAGSCKNQVVDLNHMTTLNSFTQ